MKRGIDPLIEDSTRRIQAKQSIDKIMREKANQEASRAFINSKSDKVLYERFCKDFKEASETLKLGSEEDDAQITCA